MAGYYDHHHKHFVALDCIIFGFDGNDLKLLLVKRGFAPEKGKWSLMGGFLKAEESLDEGASSILNQLTGLTEVYMEQLYAYGEVNRDPVARTLSVAYYALMRVDDYDELQARAHEAQWFPVAELPHLIFDHNEMVQRALARLKKKTRNQPVGFELLPEKFTIPQLRRLYEAIHQQMIDPRNFSKKLHTMKLLTKLDEKDKSSSKKGAYLYQFDQKRYEKLLSEGFSFWL
jgi:ADP-ribose pyrophosphatase YjhB (NUDIX family)